MRQYPHFPDTVGITNSMLRAACAVSCCVVLDSPTLQTSAPDVWAVGDVASFPLLVAGGELVRQEHVTHARSSATHAAKSLMGANLEPYDYKPYFYSR